MGCLESTKQENSEGGPVEQAKCNKGLTKGGVSGDGKEGKAVGERF